MKYSKIITTLLLILIPFLGFSQDTSRFDRSKNNVPNLIFKLGTSTIHSTLILNDTIHNFYDYIKIKDINIKKTSNCVVICRFTFAQLDTIERLIQLGWEKRYGSYGVNTLNRYQILDAIEYYKAENFNAIYKDSIIIKN